MIPVSFRLETFLVLFAVLGGSSPSLPARAAVDAHMPFLVGADLSWVPQQEAEGRRFSDARGERDILEILRDHGFNAARLRLFHDPAAEAGYSAKGFCGLESTLAMAARVKAADMTFLLDYHYSDTWADPGHQVMPAAWRGLGPEALTNAVFAYTRDTLAEFGRRRLAPEMVQIGNEINNGMLWPAGTLKNWDGLSAILRAAAAGVRAGAPAARIVLHIANGGDNAKSRWFLDRAIASGIPFDIIGQSYYPKWHGTIADLRANLDDLARRYRKPVLVAEHTSPGVRDVHAVARALPDGLGLGAFIWEPTDPKHGGLFDAQGRALPALNQYPPP